MKPAHWSKVTKAIRKKYGLDWQAAKTAYKGLKTTTPRTPSLRMVTGLPDKLPKAMKGARVKNPVRKAKIQDKPIPPKTPKSKYTTKPVISRQEQKYFKALATPEPALPPNVVLAPAPEVLGPAIVPKRQGARNQFERFLKEAGLPVSAIARNETGRALASKWRDKEGQEKLTKLLKQTFKQIKRDGAMKPQTKERLTRTMEKLLGETRSNQIWNNIMRQLYGAKRKK